MGDGFHSYCCGDDNAVQMQVKQRTSTHCYCAEVHFCSASVMIIFVLVSPVKGSDSQCFLCFSDFLVLVFSAETMKRIWNCDEGKTNVTKQNVFHFTATVLSDHSFNNYLQK